MRQADDYLLPRVRDIRRHGSSALDAGRKMRAEILGVSREGILESNGYSSSVHSMEADLEVVYPIWNFSPYLLSFAEPHAETRWSDISARKAYERQLRYYASLQENVTDAVKKAGPTG